MIDDWWFRTEVDIYRDSFIWGNRQYTFCKVVSEVSSFAGNPVSYNPGFQLENTEYILGYEILKLWVLLNSLNICIQKN